MIRRGKMADDAATADSESGSLASWFEVWHPTPKLIKLGLTAVITGLIVYFETVAVTEMSKSFALTGSHADTAAEVLSGDVVLRTLVRFVQGYHVTLLIVAAFVVLRVVRTYLEVTGKISGAAMSQKARADLEAMVLDHLLRKDDAFFTNRPPAEILNRLSADIARVIERRSNRSAQRQSVLQLIGNIYFLFTHDWLMAVAGVGACAVGGWAMQRFSQPAAELDRSFLAQDDRVKAMFEDYLRASPEAQVADLRGAIRERFKIEQEGRAELFTKFSTVKERVTIISTTFYLLALLSLFIIAIYFSRAHVPHIELVALVPAILKVLPELFTNTSQLVTQRLNLQLAETSEKRLLEYDAGAMVAKPEKAIEVAKRAAIAIAAATYRYRTVDGSLQGGVVDVTTTFPESRWTAIVGAAGSGKSTLLQLVVGRAHPQVGSVSYGDARYEALGSARANVLTLMPQALAILDASIKENLAFGQANPKKLDTDDLALIEKTGLGAICRVKALTMLPAEAERLDLAIGDVRKKMRAKLEEHGFKVVPFESGGRDPDDTVIERLAASRADRTRLSDRLFDPSLRPALDALAKTPLGRALAERVPKMLEDTRGLLGLSTHAEYTKLAPHPVDELVWQRRVAALGSSASKKRSKFELRDLLLVALTARVREYGDPSEAAPEPFRELLGSGSVPLDAAKLHPYLTWRDNVVFGNVDAPNARAESRIERIITELLEAEGHAEELVKIGLEFQVGRSGTRLSGGQRQIIALSRALLRRTPVLVLDEPTSALDPNSRARVASVLRDWASEHAIIMVSHDPELVRATDEVRLLEGGRLSAAGPFAELEKESPAFRTVLKL
jgi:ABC-type multidrug transport system fused ATPase/permease subunit